MSEVSLSFKNNIYTYYGGDIYNSLFSFICDEIIKYIGNYKWHDGLDVIYIRVDNISILIYI